MGGADPRSGARRVRGPAAITAQAKPQRPHARVADPLWVDWRRTDLDQEASTASGDGPARGWIHPLSHPPGSREPLQRPDLWSPHDRRGDPPLRVMAQYPNELDDEVRDRRSTGRRRYPSRRTVRSAPPRQLPLPNGGTGRLRSRGILRPAVVPHNRQSDRGAGRGAGRLPAIGDGPHAASPPMPISPSASQKHSPQLARAPCPASGMDARRVKTRDAGLQLRRQSGSGGRRPTARKILKFTLSLLDVQCL
ncbi:hypothetical protein IQ26_06341 [Mesorhizobium tianshanense]|uniref:Uncharacterized protein n=1 Tax=Mesorhizobium tianshanense TaxID=39844 RepID=A0A562MW20_9HYPH|nr:hypothetical protein IQ26_06341 [Mesorhizobium tianshanense]